MMRQIDEKTWNELIFVTNDNIKRLLNAANDLLDINIKENNDILFEHPYLSAGLYTYAVEEYGKLLYLKSLQPTHGKIEFDYTGKFRNHSIKFELAIKSLPEECVTIGKGFFDPAYFDPNIFDTRKSTATFIARMGIFYSDLTDEGKIHVLPNVDATILRKAILTFSEMIGSHKS